jgi:hypothetical protein
MLPSFRLVAATFLCGFIVVFAGLRLAVSLNDIHEGLPVIAAAHAAPVMYDLRFAVRSTSQTPAPVNVTALVIDRAAPLDVGPPLSIARPDQIAKGTPASVEPTNIEPAKAAEATMPEPPAALETATPPAEQSPPVAPANTPGNLDPDPR